MKLLCDEVFGQDNFVANVIWHKRYAASNDSKDIPSMHDYVLVYQKSETFLRNLLPRTEKQDALYRYDDNDGKGKWRPDNLSVKTVSSAYLYPVINPNTGETYSPPKGRCWLTSSAKMQEWITEGRVYFGQDGQGAPQLKRYLNEVQQGIVPTTYWGYDEVGHTDSARKDLKSVFDGVAPFDNPKPVGVIQKSLLVGATKDAIVLDFFAGSGTTGEAVMRLNAEDGGQRQFILVQIPQPIDPKKQKEAHSFVTQTLGKPEATIFEITAERLRRAGDKINAAQRSQGKPEVDAGFRVYTLADDPHALVHRTPLDQATQADVAALQTAIATPQPEQRPVVLANLLLTEGLPLSATLTPLAAGSVADALWQAQDTLLVLDAVPLDALIDLLRQRKAAGTPVHHVSVYAPWVHDDNFLQGVQTLLEAEGFSADRLRLRG